VAKWRVILQHHNVSMMEHNYVVFASAVPSLDAHSRRTGRCGGVLRGSGEASQTFTVTAYCQQGHNEERRPAKPGVAAADPTYLPMDLLWRC